MESKKEIVEMAQNVFTCPVKPGQMLYRICNLTTITPFCVYTVRFNKNGWKAYTEEDDGRTFYITDDSDWMSIVFPTLEEAEKKLAEMRGEKR